MQSVFITGLGGFIGTALAERLLSQKIRVAGIAKERNYKFRHDILERCSIVYGDLADYDLVRDAVARYEVDTIFHIGAIAVLRVATLDPLGCFSSNITGTANILEAARQCKVPRVLFFSTDKAYGTQPILPYTEDMPVKASSDPYSTSKACADLIAQSYYLSYGTNVSITRSGNIYGPGDFNLSRLIPGNIVKGLKNISMRTYTGVASDKREYMFIDDVLDAVLTVVESGGPGEIYNIGGSGWARVDDVLGQIAELTGSTVRVLQEQRDFIEIKEQYLDPAKLNRLGWKCKHNLREGLIKTIPWYEMEVGKGTL